MTTPMNNLYPSTSTTSCLFADNVQAVNGSPDAIPSMTTTVVNTVTVPVSAAVEIQSTQGGLLLPRMTSVQWAALPAPIAGMIGYDSTQGNVVSYVNGSFQGLNGLSFSSTTLTQANVQGMSVATGVGVGPVQLIAAPGAGKSIFIHKVVLANNFNTTAFAGGGVVVIQYDAVTAGAGVTAVSAASIPANFVTAAASTTYSLTGEVGGNVLFTVTANKGIYIANQTAAFTGGNAASTIVVNIWYSVVSS
jgi:hypothetical protein